VDPQSAFQLFMDNAHSAPSEKERRLSSLAFFVGYAYGAQGARASIDELVEQLRAVMAAFGNAQSEEK
jgi:hypothetical protein